MSILSKPFLYWNLRGLGGLRIYILGKWIGHYPALYHSSSTLGLWFASRRKPLFRISDRNNLFLILRAFSIAFSLLSLLISIFNILTVILLFLLISFLTEFTATFHTIFYRIFHTEFTPTASSSMTIYVTATNKKSCFLIFFNKPRNFPFGCLVATI